MTMRTGNACLAAAMIGMLATAGPGGAAELGLHPDVTWATKYMAHGFNIGGDHPAWEPSLTVDALAPGLQLTAWYNIPADGKYRQFVEEDYLVKYNRTVFGDAAWAMNLHGYFDYWIYPNTPRQGEVDEATGKTVEDLKGYKLHAGVTFPKCLSLGGVGVVPSYNYYFWTPQNDGAFADGGVHELFLASSLPLGRWLARDRLPALNLGTSVNYHEGALGTRPAWSHATAHASATFEIAGFKLTPSVNYQWSFEDTVNPEDEFWAALSLARDF